MVAHDGAAKYFQPSFHQATFRMEVVERLVTPHKVAQLALPRI
jgi:hypothetical protein